MRHLPNSLPGPRVSVSRILPSSDSFSLHWAANGQGRKGHSSRVFTPRGGEANDTLSLHLPRCLDTELREARERGVTAPKGHLWAEVGRDVCGLVTS